MVTEGFTRTATQRTRARARRTSSAPRPSSCSPTALSELTALCCVDTYFPEPPYCTYKRHRAACPRGVEALYDRRKRGTTGAGSGVLLVIAHPDDECMFFTPTLLGLQRQGVAVHVLCLSTGNFAGLGATRALELRASCAALGVLASHVHCLDDPQLPDGPSHAWPPARIAAIVRRHCHETGLSRLVTFDSGGVSGHPNHVAVYDGVRLLLSEGSSLAG